jgi:hypothetical protein
MKNLLIIVLFLFISACADESIKSNIVWDKVSCNGFQGWDACMQHARRQCPNGFNVANQKEDIVTQVRKMNFSCKK